MCSSIATVPTTPYCVPFVTLRPALLIQMTFLASRAIWIWTMVYSHNCLTSGSLGRKIILIHSNFQFLIYKYPQHGRFQTTSMLSLNAELVRDARNCLSQADESWHQNATRIHFQKLQQSKWDGQGCEPGDLIHRLRVRNQREKVRFNTWHGTHH